MLGLKRGGVFLEKYNVNWKINADETIRELLEILNNTAKDIKHVGSTAIPLIHAKPIIDIVVGVQNLEDILNKKEELEKQGFIYRGLERENEILFVLENKENKEITHHIHVVEFNKTLWNNYIIFKDYLIHNKKRALEYDNIKMKLAKEFSNDRKSYTKGKCEIINEILNEAKQWEKYK